MNKKEKPQEPKVCKTCGCLVSPGRGRVVADDRAWSSYTIMATAQLFYCDGCAPPYDSVERTSEGWCYFKKVPTHSIRVTEEGQAIPSKEKV